MQAVSPPLAQALVGSARLGIHIPGERVRAGSPVEVRVSLANDVGRDLSRSEAAALLRFACGDEAGDVGVEPAEAPRCPQPLRLAFARRSVGLARLSVEAEGALGAMSAGFVIEGPGGEAAAASGGDCLAGGAAEAGAQGLPLRRVAPGGRVPRLQLFESCRAGVNGKVWDGGLALARYLAARPGAWPGPPAAASAAPRAIELGAGTGVASLALAALGMPVVATDEDAGSLTLLRLSAAANNLEHLLRTEVLSWGTDSPLLRGRYDMVLAADVVYDEDAFIPLVQSLTSLAHGGATMLLAHRPRGERGQQAHFFHLLEAEFDPEPIHEEADLGATIYRLHRRREGETAGARAADGCEYCCFLRQQRAQLNEWPYLGTA